MLLLGIYVFMMAWLCRIFQGTLSTLKRPGGGKVQGFVVIMRKANLSGNVPLGSFNAAFSFIGSRHIDAAATKTLLVDGFFIPLAKVQLIKPPLVLQESVRRAVPTTSDPPSLASFIENLGTQVITSATIGGKDVIYVKQHQSSPLLAMEIKNYVQDIGNPRFCSTEGLTKFRVLILFYSISKGYIPNPPVHLILPGMGKKMLQSFLDGGEEMIWNKATLSGQSLCGLLQMSFFPITLLLEGVTGKGAFGSCYKPQIEELRYFLEFQIPWIWASVQNKVPGSQWKEPVCPSLQFSMKAQKLYISQEQVHLLCVAGWQHMNL